MDIEELREDITSNCKHREEDVCFESTDECVVFCGKYPNLLEDKVIYKDSVIAHMIKHRQNYVDQIKELTDENKRLNKIMFSD